MDPHAHERKTYAKYLSQGNVEYWAYATLRIFFDYVDVISVRSVSKLWNETVLDEIYLRIVDEITEELPEIKNSPTKLLSVYSLIRPIIETGDRLEELMDLTASWKTADDMRVKLAALNTPEQFLVWKREYMLQNWFPFASETVQRPPKEQDGILYSIIQRIFYKKIVHLWREYPFYHQSADHRDHEQLVIVLKNGDVMTLEYVFEKDVVVGFSIGEVVKGLEHLWPPKDILKLTCSLNGTSHELVTYVQTRDMTNAMLAVDTKELCSLKTRPKSLYFENPNVQLNDTNLQWMMSQLGVKNMSSREFFSFLVGLVYEIQYVPAQSVGDSFLDIEFDMNINDIEAPLFRGLVHSHLLEKKLSMMCLMQRVRENRLCRVDLTLEQIIQDKTENSNSWRGVYESNGYKEQYFIKLMQAAENTSILQWEEQYAVLDIHPWYKTNVWSYWRVIVFQLYGQHFFVRVLFDETLGASIEHNVYLIRPGQQWTNKSLFYDKLGTKLLVTAAFKPMSHYSIDADFHAALPKEFSQNSIDEKSFLDLLLTITGDIAFATGVNNDSEPEIFLDFKTINDYLDLKARDRGEYFDSDGVKHNRSNPLEKVNKEPFMTQANVKVTSGSERSDTGNGSDRLIILLPEILPMALQGSNLIEIRRVAKSWNTEIMKEIERRVQKETGIIIRDCLKVYSLFHLRYKVEEIIPRALKIRATYQNAEKLREMFHEINKPENFRLWKREYMRQNWRSLMKNITKYEAKNEEIKELQKVVDRVFFAKLQHFFREHPYVGRSSDRSDYEKLYFVLDNGELLELEWCFNKHMVVTQSMLIREEGDNGPDLWPPIDVCYMKVNKGKQSLDLVSYVQLEDQCGKPKFVLERNYQPVTLRFTTSTVKSPMVALKEENMNWFMKQLNVKATSTQGFFYLLQTLLFEQNFPIIKTIQNGNLGVQPLVSSNKGTGVLYNGLIYSHLQEKKVAMMSLLDKILAEKLKDQRSWRGLFHVPARAKDSIESEYKALRTLAEGITILDWDEGFGCYELHPWWRRLVYTYSRVIRFSLKDHVFILHILYDKTLAEMMLFRVAVIDHNENAVPMVEFGQNVQEPKQMQKFQRQFLGSGVESFGKFVLDPSWRQGYPLQLSQRMFIDLMLTLCGDVYFVTSAWYGSYELNVQLVNEFSLRKKKELM